MTSDDCLRPEPVAPGDGDNSVDSSKLTLRVMPKGKQTMEDIVAITELLKCESNAARNTRWRLRAPLSLGSDIDGQIAWILGRVTGDLEIWKKVTSEYRVDLFCGLFMERRNRGITLAPETLLKLGLRGISLGFDIYAPDVVAVELK